MLSEKIKETRENLLLSQEVFAKKLNVSVSTINRWETGKVRPNISAMKELKDFCAKNKVPFGEIENEWRKAMLEEEK